MPSNPQHRPNTVNIQPNRCQLWLFAAVIFSGHHCAAQPSHKPVASQRKAAAAILDYLYDGQPANGVLTGQNLGHSNHDIDDGYRSYFKPLKYRVGRTPAIMSIDYGYDEITRSFANTHYRLIRHVQAGGIVTISMHPPNPWHNSDSHDTSTGNLRELLKPGTLVHQRWRKELDHLAKGLAELRDQNIIVLWRPFHEMNGGWFWWCPKNRNRWPEPETFVAVWRDMFNYFTQEKKLDNLLWVYSAAVQTNRRDPTAVQFYPGHDVVDVTGLDWYMNDVSELDRFGSYSQLVKLGKPMGLTEFGPSEKRDGTFQATQLVKACERYPKLRFYVFWHSWPGAHVAMVDIASGPQLLHDKRAITLRQLPPFSDSVNLRRLNSAYP